jgi:hypothetical protein
MRRHSLMLLAGAVTLLAVGCTSGDETATNDASPSPTAEAAKSPTAAQSFDNPVVSEKGKDGKLGGVQDPKKKVAKNKVAGLLQSTDPDERAKRVQAGIPKRGGLDPFASLPPILTFRAPEPIAGGGNNGGGTGQGYGPGGSPTFGPGGGSPLAGSGGSGGRPGGGGSGTSVANLPSIPSFQPGGEIRLPRPPIARRPAAPTITAQPMNPGNPGGGGGNPGLKPLPVIPEPSLAKAVEVTGVVTIAGETQAIVKAPNEPTSRHVAVGQRLANGQVLVKRIEVNAGTDPIVIFEQNGIEVARAVGEKAAPGVPGVPTAFVPTPPVL